ncbi:MAG: hypothetical protein LBO09_01300 [Candidatus Peribacteria bacterium]|nr:hypothetical protein [Candidatus Peribacteria bacterium]
MIYSLGQDNRNRDTEEFKNPHQSNSSTEFTDEEQRYIAKEQTVRQLQNLLIAGAGYRVFDALETEKYQQKLNAIDPELYPLQHKVMGRALRDMLDPQNI